MEEAGEGGSSGRGDGAIWEAVVEERDGDILQATSEPKGRS